MSRAFCAVHRLLARGALLVMCGTLGASCPAFEGEEPDLTGFTADRHGPIFPILSGAHAGTGCAQCHGDGDSFTEFACTGCHEHAQARVDPAHEGMAGYSYGPTTCYACHPTGEAEGIDHERRFPIGPGTAHQGIGCGTCHIDPKNRKVFDCISCHTHERSTTDGDHAGVEGYQYASPSCYGCHPQGTVEAAVDHRRMFPIAAGATHAGIGCLTCHAVPSDRKQVTCGTASCHPSAGTASEHTQVGGYRYESPLCLRCHGDAQVDGVAAHLPFRIGSNAKHFRESCLACHPAMRADKSFAADFGVAALSCAACHSKGDMDDKHSGQPGYAYAPATCISGGCHADGSKP